MSPLWLEQYYGEKWMKALNPVVVMTGKSHAVVRLSKPGEVVHVLVRKSGRHDTTSHKVLLIGVPEKSDLERMKKRLAEVDTPT